MYNRNPSHIHTRPHPQTSQPFSAMLPSGDQHVQVAKAFAQMSSTTTTLGKVDAQLWNRRESLLTRQLHSETEHTDEDDMSRAPPRALSTQSVWSNPSVASTAELTSDDGHSIASPATSPPLPPTTVRTIVPILEKPFAKEPLIVGQEEKTIEGNSEKTVEAGLGRKRCISFACGKKETKAPTPQQPVQETTPQSSASPPKRKCMLKFACPTRTTDEKKSPLKPVSGGKRPISPPPPARRQSSKSEDAKVHRGSDSTVTHVSPKSFRKIPITVPTAATPTTPVAATLLRKKSFNDSDNSTEATRFHEFASSDDEPEEWVQEATCHRSRLTVSDTLQKENIIRKACEEVEEEVVEEEEEEEEEEEDEDDLDDNDLDEDREDDEMEGEDEETDDGFCTDDEEGFAESDSEGEDWWRPAGMSTAATSVDQLERFTFARRDDTTALSSSHGSLSSTGHTRPPRTAAANVKRKRNPDAVAIHGRHQAHELPDSTDFVCGTLDEDRPLEQAFLNRRKQKEAAKHVSRPQDIDPTFPTSDPEMDEEDDEDLEDPPESEEENFMHGELDELDGDNTARHRPSARPRAKSNPHRSPPPPPRHKSPAPAALKRHGIARSPAPVRRNTARSPPPAKLFGQSPKRNRSRVPNMKFVSPPNTRRASPTTSTTAIDYTPHVLASRPQLTHTASLPRGGFMLGKQSALRTHDDEGSDTAAGNGTGEMKRGAIDIFKGLEKKRQRRKEKLYQKACAKAAAKGEKAYKVKPGKGAQRMREVGLELQRYHGKGGHIISM